MTMKSKNGYGFLIKWIIILGDILILNIVFYLSFIWTNSHQIEELDDKFRIALLVLNFCYFVALAIFPVKIYKPVVFTDKVVQRSISLVALHAILFISSIYILKLSDSFPVLFTFYYYLSFLIILTIWRVLFRELLKYIRKVGRNYKKVIIVGAGKNGMALYGEMKKESAYGYRVFGFFDDNILLKQTLPNYLGMTHDVEEFVLENRIDEIYCTLPNSQDEKIVRIFNFAERNMIRFYIVPEFSRYVKKKMNLDTIESIPIMGVRSEPLQSLPKQIVKRSFDVIFSSVFLITLFPIIYLIVALLIKSSSPGPVIFRQKRTGIYGKDFYCYKFRSMKENKTADLEQATKGDPRITKVGLFLRKSNLDELPQFINVLKGDMSVVGPRPHMLKHTEIYSSVIDKYMVRHLVKPGITGWAQVNGYRGETKTMEQMEGRVRLDVWYIENWTILLDLKIIFVTVLNMFRGDKNAY